MSSRRNKEDRAIARVYRVAIAALFALYVAALCVACSPKMMPSHNDSTSHKDSTSVQIVTRDSLVYVPIPLEKNQVIVEMGDTSRLETSVAKSEAYVNEHGRICHTLENKSDQKLPVIVPVTSKTIYTGVTHTEVHTITNYVEVEKPLSWWQKFRQGAFGWLTGAVLALLLWVFRKPLLKLIGI